MVAVPETLRGAACNDNKRSDAKWICSGHAGLCFLLSAFTVGFIFLGQPPAAPRAGNAVSTGAATVQEVQHHCPGTMVVGVHVYHFPGIREYGHTKSGAHMCEAKAKLQVIEPQ